MTLHEYLLRPRARGCALKRRRASELETARYSFRSNRRFIRGRDGDEYIPLERIAVTRERDGRKCLTEVEGERMSRAKERETL